MKLACPDFENQFHQYREYLRKEIHCFRDSVSVLRQISDHTHDHLNEINLAPGFFHTTEAALFNTIVLWADKLFDDQGERGLFNFLSFVEYNRDWLSATELQRRKSYPDDHWMLKNRIPITVESILADRLKIKSLSVLPSIKLRRDKFHGHFDKKYFFDRLRLQKEAEINWVELEEAGDVMGMMLNNYSSDFDGVIFSWSAPEDLRCLFETAQRGFANGD